MPMIRCPVCRVRHVANTIFCSECGLYLLESERPSTDPLETSELAWGDETSEISPDPSSSDTGPLVIRLRVTCPLASMPQPRTHELEVALLKPVRLGRMDPVHDIYPEVDLTDDLAIEHGVSREHVCILRKGDVVLVEDLASTNGTLLNGRRLAPYLPEPLRPGDRLQLGKLVIEVNFEPRPAPSPSRP